MSTNTSSTSKISKASSGVNGRTTDSTIRRGLRTGEHICAVQFAA
jgi:hypothetical protein